MHTVHIIIAILVVLLAATIYMWFTKPTAVQIIPATQETCDCSNQIDEAYDIGYADGFNLTTVAEEDDNAVETFYDYETSKKKSKKDENTAGKGKKYQKSTGSPVVKQVGGLCPKDTQEITSGKNKGKCQRTGDWYKTYRGVDEKGRAFTCTGGRVSNGKQCVCDEASGKQWNGKKCMCTSGYDWDSKSKRCIKKGQFKDLLNKVNAKKPAASGSKSCPQFQKWDGSKCVCDYAAGVNWDGSKCVCDTNAGYQWNGSKCVKKDGTKCPSGQYFDIYTAKCKKP
ncbi:hypothetical protein ATCVTN60342_463L [Acanthocystis turfacea Chlorella virus TN603.4.2]|nr:hypothetical protein ATCVTN60342_463L [Acanthocystis turfacea Chlorella virus TN603.4.2]